MACRILSTAGIAQWCFVWFSLAASLQVGFGRTRSHLRRLQWSSSSILAQTVGQGRCGDSMKWMWEILDTKLYNDMQHKYGKTVSFPRICWFCSISPSKALPSYPLEELESGAKDCCPVVDPSVFRRFLSWECVINHDQPWWTLINRCFHCDLLRLDQLNQLSSPLLSRILMGCVTEAGCSTMHHLPGRGWG